MSRTSFLQDMLFSVFDRQEAGEPLRDGRSISSLCESLLTERGEVSGNRLSLAILESFEKADEEARREFFHWLNTELDIAPAVAAEAADAYAKNQTAGNWFRLNRATESRRLELLKRINRVPGATGKLVMMRQKLLPLLVENPELRRLDMDFEKLFTMWFNRGFLVLRQIDWHTPASILEKIIAYEAVHAITDWQEMRRRLEPDDRLCFAFFHPAMQDEPLIFVEVALLDTQPDSIQSILRAERHHVDPQSANTAVFYSISNCQAGLRGVSFGNFLIKQVAVELASLYPGLKQFRTLSPVPSFVPWIKKTNGGEHQETYNEAVQLAVKLSDGRVDHENDTDMRKICALAARYLVEVRRSDDRPMDPVARFHLGNGASLDAVIPAADLSFKGLAQSAGVMVSYLYDLDKVIKNHEAYASENTVAHSKYVARMISGDRKVFRIKQQNG